MPPKRPSFRKQVRAFWDADFDPEKDEICDPEPEREVAPDVLSAVRAWSTVKLTQWDYWQQRRQPEQWLDEVLLVESEYNRFQAKQYEDLKAGKGAKRQKKTFSRGEVAAYGASHGYDGWPSEAVLEVWQGTDAILED